MCQNKHHKEKEDNPFYPEKKFRLATFFNMWWDIYKKSPKEYIRPEQYKAANSIRVCRTAALGIDNYVCEECGEITEIFHSCKNRFCPTCSWKDTMEWAERIKSQMMNLPHRHIVITLPHKLNGLIKCNDKYLLNNLLRAAAATFKDWMEHKYNLKPGIISVLHTFGEKKNYHVHVHMIVSWGGINITTKELEKIKGEYVKYNFLQDKFRCKFEDEMIKMFDEKTLKHKFRDRQSFMSFVSRINKKNWQLHLESPMEIPTEVVRYIGRYSKQP